MTWNGLIVRTEVTFINCWPICSSVLAHNPNSKEYVREKYKKKLQTFEEQCELITYLSKIMKRKYLEQEDRPIDFNHKLESFVSLQQLSSC